MASKKCNKSFFGMRLIDPYQQFVGLVWESLTYDILVLRLYHINEYGKYVTEDIVNLSSDEISKFERKEDVLTYLKRIARKRDGSYNLYIDETLYKMIERIYSEKAELEILTD